jgi:hypothetical protein
LRYAKPFASRPSNRVPVRDAHYRRRRRRPRTRRRRRFSSISTSPMTSARSSQRQRNTVREYNKKRSAARSQSENPNALDTRVVSNDPKEEANGTRTAMIM